MARAELLRVRRTNNGRADAQWLLRDFWVLCFYGGALQRVLGAVPMGECQPGAPLDMRVSFSASATLWSFESRLVCLRAGLLLRAGDVCRDTHPGCVADISR